MLGITLGLALALTGATLTSNDYQVPPASVGSPFVYSFNSAGTLQEAGSPGETTSPYFWLNSGGELRINGSSGSTMMGDAPSSNKWYELYRRNNALDTDDGIHPQNLFRLVTRSVWENVRAEAAFRIEDDNFSSSPNRNASNGLLLMSRYRDSDTLYYAGIRVDGDAVLKKKYNGTYYTMAQKEAFPGEYNGWQDNENLLPHDEWVALRSESVTNADGSVTVRLFMRRAGSSTWKKLLEAVDRGQFGGTSPIRGSGYAGIRTDFMDVRFDNLRLYEL